MISGFADGIIVGSAVINKINESKDPEKAVKNVSKLIRDLSYPLK